MAWLRFAFAATVITCGAQSPPAFARSTSPANACLAHAPEAATRSGLGPDVVARVMMAESRGNPNAVSLKGAIGCMQIMPATWAYLSRQYGLGTDPFNARMNMIGGALYLAELTRRFGLPGAYAAYNAGPSRYVRFAAGGVPLPAETVAYAARLGGAGAPAIAEPPRARWQEAGLFLNRSGERRRSETEPANPEPATPLNASHPSTLAEEPRSAGVMASLFPLADTPRDRR